MPHTRPVRVLYLQGATQRAGAEAVLLARLPHLVSAGIEPIVLSLVEGPFVRELRQLEILVETLPSAAPRVRDAARFLRAIRDVAATARRLEIDVMDGWGEDVRDLGVGRSRGGLRGSHDPARRAASECGGHRRATCSDYRAT